MGGGDAHRHGRMLGDHLTDVGWAEEAGRALRGGGSSGDDAPHLPLVLVPVWAMFTDLELSHIMHIPFALPLMLAFVLLANVVLVNLLIAMFADTYSRIKKTSEVCVLSKCLSKPALLLPSTSSRSPALPGLLPPPLLRSSTTTSAPCTSLSTFTSSRQ